MGGLFLLSRRSQGGPGGPGGNNPLAFGKSKAKFQMEPNTGITFDDVAGVDEAKQDFMEVCQCCPSSVETQHLSSYAQVAGRLTSTDPSGLFCRCRIWRTPHSELLRFSSAAVGPEVVLTREKGVGCNISSCGPF